MCIFILTILVPLPDSFVLLFSAVTVEFPFRFIKVYLISSQTLRKVSEEKTRFFLFFSPVCDLSEPTVYTYTRSNDNREQRFGMFPIFFFFFPLQHLINHSDELNHCCVSVCSAALSWIAALIHFILGISWIARETS